MGPALQLNSTLRLSRSASMQSLGDGAVVLMADSGQLYTCNTTTENIIGLVDGNRTIGEIVELILNDYEIDRETLEGDVFKITEELVSEGILQG